MKFVKSTLLGLSLAVATATLAQADHDIPRFNTFENQYFPRTAFDASSANVYDVNKSYNKNFGTVINNSKTPLLSSDTIKAMQVAVLKYTNIANNGGWAIIRGNLSLGMNSEQVIKLRQRLYSTGDLPAVRGNAWVYDNNVVQAVRRFQARHGLRTDGAVNPRTLNALNISAKNRIRQLKININRLKKARKNINKRAIVVNIPEMKLEIVEAGKVVSRHVVVVGKPDRQTPVISSTMSQINFNPYWHVPVSIVRKDLVPTIISNPSYIKKTGMRIYTKWGGKELNPKNIDFTSPKALTYAYRQDPSPENALGQIKLNFPNAHAVFLHDTSIKSLFSRQYRAYSSGCVRIQGIREVVDWVLRDEPKWSAAQSAKTLSTGKRKDINLKSRISIRLAYITTWATPAGTVHFRDDIYNRDGLSKVAVN